MTNSLVPAAAIAAIAAGTLLGAAPAMAEGPRSARVSHADLNLASATGRARLERRVRAAAERVCGVGHERDVALMVAARRCAGAAREGARPAMELAYRNAAQGQLAASDVSVTVTP